MKFKVKKILKVVALVLVGVVLGGAVSALGTSFKRDLNEDNLIKVEDYVIESEKTDVGLTVDVNEDTGVIKLSGTADEDYTFVVAQVELEAGTYTISGYDNSSKGRCHLSVLYDVNQIAMSGAKSATFTLEDTQTVTVQIVVSEDASFNLFTANTFKPCLVEGNEAGNIFAK